MRYLLLLTLCLLTFAAQAWPTNPKARIPKPRRHQLSYWPGKQTVASRTKVWGLSHRYHK